MSELQQTIDQAWEDRASLSPAPRRRASARPSAHVLAELDAGALRVAEKIDGEWTTHQWIKKAVLLSFRLEDNVLLDGGRSAGTTRCRPSSPTTMHSSFSKAASAWCPAPWCAAAPSSRPMPC
jgi:2,3,4,5-tetrahydropyridine-2,6-dicarboxylate N-succinyltransferase